MASACSTLARYSLLNIFSNSFFKSLIITLVTSFTSINLEPSLYLTTKNTPIIRFHSNFWGAVQLRCFFHSYTQSLCAILHNLVTLFFKILYYNELMESNKFTRRKRWRQSSKPGSNFSGGFSSHHQL